MKPDKPVTASTPAAEASVASDRSGLRDPWRKLTWPLMLACGFLIFVSASSVHLVTSSQSSQEMMNRALLVENKLWGILAAVRVAESEQRGYLLTGDPVYLDVSRSSVDAGLAAIAAVKSITADSPAQQRTLTEIEPLFLQKIAELRETIRLYDAGEGAAALDIVRTGVGRELTKDIRLPALRLMEDQRQLIARHTSFSASTNIWLLLVNLLGLALIIVLGLVYVLAMRRSTARELAESESRAEELRSIVDDRHRNEQKFRAILDGAPDAIVIMDRSGKITLVNVQAETLFGYARADLLGQEIEFLLPPRFRAKHLSHRGVFLGLPKLRPVGRGLELYGQRKDGTEFPVEVSLSPLETDDGILVSSAIRDISVRKETERHLAQLEARSRGLLDAAPDAMVVVNRLGEIVLANLQAEKEFGYGRSELLGQKITNIVPDGFSDRLLADGVDVLAAQIPAGIDLTGRRRDGSEFPIEIMLSPLQSGEGILVVRDASVRKDAEKHLAQVEARYYGLLEAAPAAMVVVNRSGKIVLLNLQAEKDFGYRRDELLGQKLKSIIPAYRAEPSIDNGRPPVSEPALQPGAGIELTGLRKDGGEFPIDVMLSKLQGAEVLLVVRDISIQRKTERLKDEFVATVSHELRTPLTSISGSLGLLAGQWSAQLPETASRLLAIAHTNSQRLVRLINDILDIEKLESGRVVFNLSKVAVLSLVEHAIEDTRGFADSYGVLVRLGVIPEEVHVNADSDRLAQIVTNLLSNAIKFSPGGGEVLVAVEKRANDVRITVRDHGSGIPDEFKPHIFEKFAQADATNTRRKGGTGLGLSIVKQIVERLGGSIGFDNASDGGAVFHVDLPAWDGRAGGEIDIDPGVPGARILFCEDNHEVAAVVRLRLRQAGFAVDFGHTVAAALGRMNDTRYAAVLIDLQLPDGDGVGLIVRLRAQPHYRDTPVIVIAGNPDQGQSDVRSSRLNVLHWLNKPIAFGPLIEALHSAIAAPRRKRARILHVDDDYDVLALVNEELRSIADVISADSVESARRALATDRIDLAVLDISMGDESGLDLLPDLRCRLGSPIPVIIFSTKGASLTCDEHVQVSLSKMNSPTEGLAAAVRDRLSLLPA